jgi:hypothetical protein
MSSDCQEPAAILITTAPENIAYIKFVLESYEGLGIVRTLEQDQAKVVILGTVGTAPVLRDLLESMKSEVDFNVLDPDAKYDENFLLG